MWKNSPPGSAVLFDAYGQAVWGYGDQSFHDYSPFWYKGQAGQVSDPETGLVYCHHRFYDPGMGRWISRDPIGLDGGVNVYAYCGGNPVMSADPSGLQSYGDYLRGVLRGYWNAIDPVRAFQSFIRAPGYWSGRAYARLANGSSNILTLGFDLNSEFIAQNLAFFCRKEAWDFEHPEIFGETFGSGLVMAGGFLAGFAESPALLRVPAPVANTFGGLKVAGQYGLATCKVLRKMKAGKKGLQAHHLMERRFAGLFGQSEGDMLGVVLTDAEHAEITLAWRREIGYTNDNVRLTTRTATRADVIAAARRVYANYPELLKELLRSLGY